MATTVVPARWAVLSTPVSESNADVDGHRIGSLFVRRSSASGASRPLTSRNGQKILMISDSTVNAGVGNTSPAEWEHQHRLTCTAIPSYGHHVRCDTAHNVPRVISPIPLQAIHGPCQGPLSPILELAIDHCDVGFLHRLVVENRYLKRPRPTTLQVSQCSIGRGRERNRFSSCTSCSCIPSSLIVRDLVVAIAHRIPVFIKDIPIRAEASNWCPVR